ncbi:MAG TPA: metallophosphoesterase [Anaerolineae bacterium]|nr:metallophosphoesterase [Anaerolineae bacterium]
MTQTADEIIIGAVTRRSFIKVACGTLLGGATLCALGPLYAAQIEPHWIEIIRLNINLPGLPEALDGLTIAQLSDFHLGPYVNREYIRQSVELANGLGADINVLTGDFVYSSARYSHACAQELALLRARYGTYAVLGNHDIWTNADEVANNLSQAGIIVLRDEKFSLDLDDTRLWILGTEDTGHTGGFFSDFRKMWQTSADRLATLLDGIPSAEPRLLLVHNPDFTEMLPEGRIDLALCGHTHGGQIRLPLLGSPIVPSCFGQKYAAGLVSGPRTITYVNRGIGLIPPPVRFNCRPEITLLHLKSG